MSEHERALLQFKLLNLPLDQVTDMSRNKEDELKIYDTVLRVRGKPGVPRTQQRGVSSSYQPASASYLPGMASAAYYPAASGYMPETAGWNTMPPADMAPAYDRPAWGGTKRKHPRKPATKDKKKGPRSKAQKK